MSTLWMASCLGLVLTATTGSDLSAEPQEVILTGQALPLAEVARHRGLKLDLLTAKNDVALQTDEGEIIPLLPDQGSRALFADDRLRHQPLRVQGRRFKGFPYLQVIGIQIRHEGRYQTPEYYCDVCSISLSFPQECPCCQGPMVLRMKPEGTPP